MAHLERLIERESTFNTGERLSYLPYKDLSHLFYGISEGLENQIKGDKEKKRVQLVFSGEETVVETKEIAGIMVRMGQKNEEKIERINKNDLNFELGEKASYLRYDNLENFLLGIEKGMEDQNEDYMVEKNEEMADLGTKAIEKIKKSTDIIDEMWRISEPYMKDKDKL